MRPEVRGTTIWDVFDRSENPNNTVGVNKYLWNASLEVLNFLPVQTVDPFTGVIQTGYGTPPGGGRSYRATIKIADPANASGDTIIECRRCNAVRGTVADLHTLARRGRDLFEF